MPGSARLCLISGLLVLGLAVFNAVLECADESTRTWFGTGEMRSVLLTRV